MNEPQYTNQWFNDYIKETWEEELKPLAGDIKRYLEIGVCEGQSMRWVLENLLVDDGDFAFGVDSYYPKKPKFRRHTEIHKRNRKNNLQPWFKKVRIIEQASGVALREDPLRDKYHYFDLIYVDGSHLAVDTLEDLMLCWRLLRRGGRIIIDDYHRPHVRGKPCTNAAAKAWISCLAATKETEEGSKVWVPDVYAKRGGRIVEEWRIIRPEHPDGEPRQVCFRRR